MTINTNNHPCSNCKGGLHCYNQNSECYLNFCGMYPGTGPQLIEDEKEEGDEEC